MSEATERVVQVRRLQCRLCQGALTPFRNPRAGQVVSRTCRRCKAQQKLLILTASPEGVSENGPVTLIEYKVTRCAAPVSLEQKDGSLRPNPWLKQR